MQTIKFFIFSLATIVLFSCTKKEEATTFVVKNTLDIDRTFETVVLSKSELKVDDLTTIGIKDLKTGQLQVTQLVDNDGDGVMDDILFQPKIAANAENTYEVVTVTDAERPKADELCYSRFIPERTDDYTWENNRVAFRMYGPTAQKMIEDNVPGGTLSSGVDAWLKRVEYPIINKWYKKTVTGKGSYHEDTGEGLDDFHVGGSRGIGGTAVKVDTTYYVSKNYDTWKTITTGPIRTSFIITYAVWDASGIKISESKHISLDYGSNLNRIEVAVKGTDVMSVGLTLHENAGVTTENPKEGGEK